MNRVTTKMVEGKAMSLNEVMQAKGSKHGVALTYSYGYTQLYLIDLEDYEKRGCMLRQLTSGTKREVLEYMQGMSAMLNWIALDEREKV